MTEDNAITFVQDVVGERFVVTRINSVSERVLTDDADRLVGMLIELDKDQNEIVTGFSTWYESVKYKRMSRTEKFEHYIKHIRSMLPRRAMPELSEDYYLLNGSPCAIISRYAGYVTGCVLRDDGPVDVTILPQHASMLVTDEGAEREWKRVRNSAYSFPEKLLGPDETRRLFDWQAVWLREHDQGVTDLAGLLCWRNDAVAKEFRAEAAKTRESLIASSRQLAGGNEVPW